MSIINFPLMYVPDPEKGRPLFYGQIFVGIPDLDPEIPANQKQLRIVQEDGTRVDVSQPFILSAGGVPVYNGATVRLNVDGNYSFKILDKNGGQTYYVHNAEDQIGDTTQVFIFDTVAEYKAFSTAFPIGKIIRLLDRGAEFTVIAGTGTANNADIIGNILVIQSIEIIRTQTITATSIGCGGNTLGTPQVIEWQRLFILSQDPIITKVILPDGNWYVDNSSGAIAVGGDCIYEHEGHIIFSDRTTQLFVTDGVDNITWAVKVWSSDETVQDFIGGGYVRFENGDNLQFDGWEVSKTSWQGLKLVSCTDSQIKNGIGKWNKQAAVELEACDNVHIHHNILNKNGRNSIDDTIADMPTGWSGTLAGRGVVLVAIDAGGAPCTNCSVYKNEVKLNVEYGIRSFGEAPRVGNIDCDIYKNTLEDNGAPAGTYGGAIGLAAKGTDILINGSTVVGGDSLRMRAYNNKITRTLPFDFPISIAGEFVEATGNRIVIKGAALHLLSAIQSFSATNYTISNNKSWGAFRHIATATGCEDATVEENKAYDCKEFFQNWPAGNNNCIARNKAFHTTVSAAVAGEIGIEFTGNGNVDDNIFVGFYQGVLTGGSTVGNLRRNESKDSVNFDFKNGAINNSAFYQQDNSFTTTDPQEKGNMVNETFGTKRAGISYDQNLPTTGYYKRGHLAINVGNTAATTVMWWRRNEGTNHVLGVDWTAITAP